MRRPQHLERRGAVFYVRIRIPHRLVPHLGSSDFRKSLGTKNYADACRRCSAAVYWFETTIARMERMGAVDREKLEEAAAAYFAELQAIADQPREIPADYFDQELDFQITETRQELSKLEGVLMSRQFGSPAELSARRMTHAIGIDFDTLDPTAQRSAMEYATRAERQQMRYFLHGLTQPAARFDVDDVVFALPAGAADFSPSGFIARSPPRLVRPEMTLELAIEKYVAYQVKKGWKGSMQDESQRVYRWLKEEIDPQVPVETITHDQMREFRDCLMDLGSGGQGKLLPFRARIAQPEQPKLKFVTRQRYWRFATNLFAWLRAEYRLPDLIGDLPFEGGRGEVRTSPEPFSQEELRRFLQTPLYSGYKSLHRTKQEGDCHIRGGRWWSGVLMMFTGMRAGDVAQLLPTDFIFDAEIPHLLIQPGMLPEGKKKSSKFGERTHLVPLHPSLLALGLQQFISARAKQNPKRRVLHEFSLGGNRASAAVTKYWSPFLHDFGLFKPKRATHVHRHTVIALLRAAKARGEDIAAVVGHYGNYRATVTDGYGGPQGAERKLATLLLLDHGFDVVAALGGPYDPKKHRF